jgi:hypothetical protein
MIGANAMPHALQRPVGKRVAERIERSEGHEDTRV